MQHSLKYPGHVYRPQKPKSCTTSTSFTINFEPSINVNNSNNLDAYNLENINYMSFIFLVLICRYTFTFHTRRITVIGINFVSLKFLSHFC